jgi:hypothetical protein
MGNFQEREIRRPEGVNFVWGTVRGGKFRPVKSELPPMEVKSAGRTVKEISYPIVAVSVLRWGSDLRKTHPEFELTVKTRWGSVVEQEDMPMCSESTFAILRAAFM